MPSEASKVQSQLRELANPEIAEHSQRFFKTGPGEYGEGDQFLGIRVPQLRKVARQNKQIPIEAAAELLRSPMHEERLCALFILVLQFQRGNERERKQVFDLYCDNTDYVNNWDLVDGSAHHIVGEFLRDRSRKLLFRFAKSSDLWERRIAIISTYAYIKADDFDDTLALAEKLLNDEEDLIHKAVGWMLREVGKKDLQVEEEFLQQHYQKMPRTMLRYAIERLPKRRRQAYLHGEV